MAACVSLRMRVSVKQRPAIPILMTESTNQNPARDMRQPVYLVNSNLFCEIQVTSYLLLSVQETAFSKTVLSPHFPSLKDRF